MEPNGKGSKGIDHAECAAMGWGGRPILDYECDKKFGVICQRPYFGEVGEIGDRKLLYSGVPMKYKEAKDKCEEDMGGKMIDTHVVDEVFALASPI